MPSYTALLVTPLALLLAACPSPTGIGDGGKRTDAGTVSDAGETGTASCGNLPNGPPCCGVSGDRVTSADCGDDGDWSCAEGELCECEGEAASFICSDFCGSDAFVDPTCDAGGWSCEGLVRSDSCADDVCWGDPGECCISPSCVDGSWQCESIQDPCQ